MHVTDRLIRAGDLRQPVEPLVSSAEHSNAYDSRRHNPKPETYGGSGFSSTANDAATHHSRAKKDSRRREEARAFYLGRGSYEDHSDRSKTGWQDVVGIAWDDLKDFERFGTLVYPARPDPSRPPQQKAKSLTPNQRSRQSTPRSNSKRKTQPRRSQSPMPKRERDGRRIERRYRDRD